MSSNARSYLRVKLVGVFLVSSLIGLAWIFLDISDNVANIFFITILLLGLYVWTIRCENCNTLSFQMHKKDGTGVRFSYFNHPDKCPVCGIERI